MALYRSAWGFSSVFKGILSARPVFDLHLVLCDGGEAPEQLPLEQLTRDLAELAKYALREQDRFSSLLGDIVCLRMNPHRFDGRLRFVWRV